MSKLERAGVGPEGQLAKLDSISSALKYLKITSREEKVQREAEITIQTLLAWKTTLRKDKRKLCHGRLEATSSMMSTAY